jgi:glutamine amidotransferase
MCELFGASVAQPTLFRRWLEPFRARGGATADNPDGWGVAAWTAGALQLEKAPEPGAQSTRLARMADALRGEILIAHVRKARLPPVAGLLNTHPFAHHCCGREWVFAHNGLVPDIIGTASDGAVCRPRGQTDSEHAFCRLLAEIAGCYEKPAALDWMEHLAQLAGSIAALGKFNFLLSDGRYLLAYGHDRLHYLERTESGTEVSLVATEPLDGEEWHPFERGELRVYGRGALLLRLTPAREEPAPTAAASPEVLSRARVDAVNVASA